MPTQAETAAPQITTYHFILTVQRKNGLASARTDVIDIPAGATRQDVFLFLANKYFPGETVAVLFFDLQPNQI
jgi:hypothetical protein